MQYADVLMLCAADYQANLIMASVDDAVNLGAHYESVVLYTIHASVPMVEVLDTFSLKTYQRYVPIPHKSNTYKFLKRFHAGPWSTDPKNRKLPSKAHSCLGLVFQKR